MYELNMFLSGVKLEDLTIDERQLSNFVLKPAHSRCVKCSTESWHHSSAAVYLFLGRIIQKYLRKGHISIILSLKDKSFLCSGCCASQSEIYVKSVPFYFRSKSNWQFAGQKNYKSTEWLNNRMHIILLTWESKWDHRSIIKLSRIFNDDQNYV